MFSKIILDTSVINKLEKSGTRYEPLMKGVECGYDVVLTGTSAEELVSTPSPLLRALVSRFTQLLTSGRCIWPAQELIRLLIAAHGANPLAFNWKAVDIWAREYEYWIPRARRIDDRLSTEQKHQQHWLNRDFAKFWKGIRPKLDMILAKDPSKRPRSYREAVAIAARDGGVLLGIGQALYGFVCKDPAEGDVESFMTVCPPFRSVCFALVMAWYNWSLRPHGDKTGRAGRTDLMMAAYLPYCDIFITDDWPQRENLREVAQAAGVSCDILSLSEFEQSLLLVA